MWPDQPGRPLDRSADRNRPLTAPGRLDPDREPGPLRRAAGRLQGWIDDLLRYHTTPELIVALMIMLAWAAFAFVGVHPVALVLSLGFAVVLHYLAADTGSHVWLWMATLTVLMFVILGYQAGLDRWGPLALTLGGVSTLAYNECVRMSHWRRRDAEVDPSVYVSSVVALGVVGVLSTLGVAAARLLSEVPDRPWIWLPVAVAVLFIIAFALAVLPTVRAPHASQDRFQPGRRIPPAPLAAPAGEVLDRDQAR